MRTYEKSRALHERASRVLAGGVSSEFRKFVSPHPIFYQGAQGVTITDVDGNESLDFALSQGPMIVGHGHPQVLARVTEYSLHGQLYAGQHQLELELAETLNRLIPCAEKMRFSLSGSEADHTAFRLARAATGRRKFVRFEGHYHGWFDNVAIGIAAKNLADLGPRDAATPVAWTEGLPERVREECITLPWNDAALLRQVLEREGKDIAAVIMEPMMCNNGCIPPREGYLAEARKLCDAHGIVLIFDEVITGFRVALGGAQAWFGVIPDLAIFGKAMASGYPISVLAGKARYMDLISSGRVIHAGTMNSCNPCVAAAVATLELLSVPGTYERLHRLGDRLRAGLRAVGEKLGAPLQVSGVGPVAFTGWCSQGMATDYRSFMAYDATFPKRVAAELSERGLRILGRGLWYISTQHDETHIDTAILTFEAAVAAVLAERAKK